MMQYKNEQNRKHSYKLFRLNVHYLRKVLKMKKKLFFIILLGFGLLAACSSQKDTNIKEAIQLGKGFKKTVYTVEQSDIPSDVPDRIDYLKGKTAPFLTKDELERQLTHRLPDLPVQLAEEREADVSVKEMDFAYKDVPDNTDKKINLSYTITIELKDDEKVLDELSFDGRMRVEKRDDGWKIDWDRDQAPREFLDMMKN
jgi:hypothetical protein